MRQRETTMTYLFEVAGAATAAVGGGAALYIALSRRSTRRRTLADEVLRRMESEGRDEGTGDDQV